MTRRTPRRNSTKDMWRKLESEDNASLYQTMKIRNPASDKKKLQYTPCRHE